MNVTIPALPFATADMSGVEAVFRDRPEDFLVEEIPAYPPCGEGAFLFLRIQKKERTTEEVAGALARYLHVPRREVGYAGQKDRNAVTTQTFSVPADQGSVDGFQGDGLTLLSVDSHDNRLKTGHLRGNRFRILLRFDSRPSDAAVASVESIARQLEEIGIPNAFGPQRFGREGRTASDGFALIADPRGGPGASDRYRRKLYLSAAQAVLFNRYLQRRIDEGLLRKVLAGDVARRTDSGGLFVVEDVDVEQGRFDAREIVTAGPVFGRKTFPAAHVAAAFEEAVLAEAGLTRESFSPFGKLALGTRRANLLYPEELQVEGCDEGIWLTFSLPSGSYATVVVREFLKREVR